MAISGRVRRPGGLLVLTLIPSLGAAVIFGALACKSQVPPPPPPSTAAAIPPPEAEAMMMAPFAAPKKGPCIQGEDIDACPTTGCATKDHTPNKGLLNTVKNNTHPKGAVTFLTIDDFKWLQTEAENLLGANYHPTVHFQPPEDEEDSDDDEDDGGANPAGGSKDSSLDQSHRDLLQNLTVPSGPTVSEGDKVALVGFVVGVPRSNPGGESVNCRLKNMDPNDFHVPLSESPQSSFGSVVTHAGDSQAKKDKAKANAIQAEISGVIVEFIPHDRPADWNLKGLRTLRNDDTKVLVIGQLMFDDEHRPNPDNATRQPRRVSVWEIHPITDVRTCPNNGACTVANSHPWTGPH